MAPEWGMKKKKKSVAKSFSTRRFPRLDLVSRTSAYQPGIVTIYATPEAGNLSGHNCNKSPWIPGLWYKAARTSNGELCPMSMA